MNALRFLADESCDFAVVRVLRGAGYDVLGIYAQQRGWFTPDDFNPRLDSWAGTCLMSGLGYLGCRWTDAAAPLLTVGTAIQFNIFCLAAVMTGVTFFRQKVNSTSRF